MGCGSSKKEVKTNTPGTKTNTDTANKNNYNKMNTEQRKSQIKVRPDDVWNEIDPIDPPYPPGNANLDDFIRHEEIANESIE